MPAFSSAVRIAGAGPMPMRLGSTPTAAQETMRPRTRRSRARPAVVRTIIAAPSTMPEALPAVTKPSFSKAVGSPASASAVVSGRGCSSRSTRRARRPRPTSTGTTSSASLPLSQAAAARCWLCRANSSCSSREIP